MVEEKRWLGFNEVSQRKGIKGTKLRGLRSSARERTSLCGIDSENS